MAIGGRLRQEIRTAWNSYRSTLGPNMLHPDVAALFTQQFWEGSANSFSKNEARIANTLITRSSVPGQIAKILTANSNARFIIQMPVPYNFPISPLAAIPLPLTVRVGPKKFGVSIQFGQGRARSGRVLGFGIQAAAGKTVQQILRQDYHPFHAPTTPSAIASAQSGKEFEWLDNRVYYPFKFHYHVTKSL